MRAVIQRVSEACVEVEGLRVGAIGRGLLVLVGVEKGDTAAQAEGLARKTASMRLFEDESGRMNRSASDERRPVLVVSQFTLAADVGKGTRPSFDSAEEPEKAAALVERYARALSGLGLEVERGRFGARMLVRLVNEGPVTFVLENRP